MEHHIPSGTCSLCKTTRVYCVPMPTKPNIREKWLNALRRSENEISEDFAVCSLHFSRKGIKGRGVAVDSVPEFFLQNDARIVKAQNLRPECKAQVQRSTECKETIKHQPAKLPSHVKRRFQIEAYTAVIRCAICWSKRPRTSAVPIFENGIYTEFGVALSVVLQPGSCDNLTTRYCCLPCSEILVNCYDTIVDLRVAHLLSLKRHNKPPVEEPVQLDTLSGHDYCLSQPELALLNESCEDCNICFDNVAAFTTHFHEHIFMKNRIPRIPPTNIGTQVDEEDLDWNCELKANAPTEDASSSNLTYNMKEEVHVKEEFVCQSPIRSPDPPADVDALEAQTIKRRKKAKNDADLKNSGMYVCELCGRTLSTYRRLKTHTERHSAQPVCCSKCGDMFAQHRLTVHMKSCDGVIKRRTKRKESGLPRKPREAKNPNVKRTTCPLCGVAVVHLKLHMKRHIQGTVRKTCPDCGAKPPHLISHIKKKHRDTFNEMMDQEWTIKCQDCDATFCQNSMFRIHRILKHGEDPRTFRQPVTGVLSKWTCNVCQTRFTNYQAIWKHVKAEHGGKGIQIACEECGKEFSILQTLLMHVTTTHVEGYYYAKCRCSRYFATQKSFALHCQKCTYVLHGRRVRKPRAPRKKGSPKNQWTESSQHDVFEPGPILRKKQTKVRIGGKVKMVDPRDIELYERAHSSQKSPGKKRNEHNMYPQYRYDTYEDSSQRRKFVISQDISDMYSDDE